MHKPKPTRRYLELEKLFASKIYQEWLEEVTRVYKKFGVPLPTEPIPEPKCLGNPTGWYKKMWDKVIETKNSKEYKKALEDIHGGTGVFKGYEQMEKYNDAREKYLLHPIGEYIDFLVTNYMGVNKFDNPKDYSLYTDFISKKLLHGAKKFVEPIKISMRPDGVGKHREKALWLKIEPHTTIEDIKNNWNFIKQYQSKLPDYQERYRKPVNLKRDVRIMEIYKELKDKNVREKDKKFFSRPSSLAARIAALLDTEEYGDISEYVINKVITENKKSKK